MLKRRKLKIKDGEKGIPISDDAGFLGALGKI